MKALKERIQPNEIQWRVQSARGGKTTIVPYLTNRCVMDRFDAAFGPMKWQNHFEEWRGKGVKCTISVWDEDLGNWVSKSDGADETIIESTKGGFSDSMKRCAVQWGLGRDLYDYPMVQIEGEHKYIPHHLMQRLDKMVEAINSGEFKKNYVLLK
jgi:hypothetical protein